MTRKVTETEFFKSLVKSDNFNTIMYDEEMDRIIAEVTGGTNAVIYIYNCAILSKLTPCNYHLAPLFS